MRAHLHSEGQSRTSITVHTQMQQTNQRNLNLVKPSVTYNINMPTEGHGNDCGYWDPTISADKTDRYVWSTGTTQKVACQRRNMTSWRCQRQTWHVAQTDMAGGYSSGNPWKLTATEALRQKCSVRACMRKQGLVPGNQLGDLRKRKPYQVSCMQ